MVNGTIWDRLFDGRQFEEAHAKAVFDKHNAAVQAETPAERLLVFEVKQGWESLCVFLGKPVPDEPFPHVNDTEEFQKMIRMIKRGFGAIHAVGAVAVLAAVYAIVF